ncbi:sterol esterase [Rickenella mellea]|uniref:Carboxylic ester hydrolase n=1 Tax=Rickenella mellea TaxID=50990 RepID=A0A4Y7PKL3_9AGAM|nr:sterol esterase [Rickenella mellea]
MFSSPLALVLCFASNVLAVPVENAAAPTVILPYGRFQGVSSGGLTSFLGMPFARPPVGNLRFAPPRPPIQFSGVRQATSFGNACPQQATTLPSFGKRQSLSVSEDCLFVNVVAPTSIPRGKLLPVVFWIYGGGFEDGDTSENQGDTLVNRSIALGEPIVYVSANYRINAFGFLGGKEVKAAGIGNAGLRDQRFAMEWVQQHVIAFGGDPTKVTIWGESAGAISVGLQMVVNDGFTGGLFRGAFMESGSPLFLSDIITSGQEPYDQLVGNTGCSNASDTLACLRSVSADALMAAVNESPNIFSFQSTKLAWMPSVDGVFLTRNAQDLVAQGLYARVPFVTGDCDDEGTIFSLSTLNLTTSDELLDYIHSNYLPNATNADIAAIAQAYPDDVTQGSPFDTGTANAITPEFKRLSAIQGDLIFQGPRRFFLRAASKTQNAWSFLFKRGKVVNAPLGALHGSDLPEFLGTSNTGFLGTDALVNFVNHLNPNAPKQRSTNTTSLLSGINWLQWGSSAGAPPLLTFLDPAPTVTITPDTYRVDAMNLLIKLAREFP